MTNPGLSGGRAMLELAERCEQASGPDRELDGAIEFAVRGVTQPSRGTWQSTLHFTASLDAAMALVPEGAQETHIVSFASDEGPLGAAWIQGTAYFERGDAKTPALALVAAALRARAADTPSVKP